MIRHRFFWLTALALMAMSATQKLQAQMLPQAFGKLDLNAAIQSLPAKSNKPFVDRRLLDNGEVGVRVFRVYNPVPQHNHAFSSTYLTIASGEAVFRIAGGKPFTAGKGDMVFWERGVDHAVEKITTHPLVFIAIDAPVRREGDVQK